MHKFLTQLHPAVTFLFILVGLTFGLYTTAAKADESNWLTATPTFTKLIDHATGDDIWRHNQTCRVKADASYNRSPAGMLPAPDKITLCTYDTAWGSFGDKVVDPDQNGYQYIRLGDYSAYRRLWNNPFFDYAVPQGNKFIVSTDNQGQSKKMSMYEDLHFSLVAESKEYGLEYGYRMDDAVKKTEITDAVSGQPLWIGSIGLSQNGRWAVMAAGHGVIRYDLENHRYTTFGPRMSGAYDFDITNDGRYVLISGGNTAGLLQMYDLSTCTIESNPNDQATCQSRDLARVNTAIDAVHTTFEYTSISYDGTIIKTTACDRATTYECNVWQIALPTAYQLDYLALGDSFSSGEGDAKSAVPFAIGLPYSPLWFANRYFGTQNYLPGTDGNADASLAINQGINTKAEKCHISHRSYPFLIAAHYGMGDGQSSESRFRSVACSGSRQNDVINLSSEREENGGYRGQFEGQLGKNVDKSTVDTRKRNAINSFIPGRAAQIEFISKYKPKSATITISGNDIGFGTKITDCLMYGTCGWATDPEQKQTFASQIKSQYGEIRETIDKLRSASPQTKLYVIGYSRLTKTDFFCSQPNVFLDREERILADEVVKYLNDVIEAAATSKGVMYVNVENTLIDKGLCSGELLPVVNGLRIGEDQPENLLGVDLPTTLRLVGAESYHPNSRGHQLLFEAVRSQVGNPSYRPACHSISFNTHCGSAVPEPATPEYFRASSSEPTNTIINNLRIIADNSGKTLNGFGDVVTKAGAQGRIVIDNLASAVNLSPNIPYESIIRSTPVTVATGTTSADGSIDASFTIPADTPPGYHTLHVMTILETGEPVDITQRILVIASEQDIDGDGIANSSDACPFVTPSGRDDNHDGIDDACPSEADTMSPPPDVTEPRIAVPSYSANPVVVGGASRLSLTLTDTRPGAVAPYSLPAVVSGLSTETSSPAAEYFIGNTDPGKGKATPLRLSEIIAPSDGSLPVTKAIYAGDLPTTLPPGTHKITMRAQDKAGNWASLVDYVVVYNADSAVAPGGGRASGRLLMTPSTARGDLLPGLKYAQGVSPGTPSPSPTKQPQEDRLSLAFNIEFTKASSTTPPPQFHIPKDSSNFHLSYVTGTNCEDLAHANNCFVTEISTTSDKKITHFSTEGENNSRGTIYGKAVAQRVRISNASTTTASNPDGSTSLTTTPGERTTSSKTLHFKASFTDAKRLVDTTAPSRFEVTFYESTVDPRNPGTAAPYYRLSPIEVERGKMRIYF